MPPHRFANLDAGLIWDQLRRIAHTLEALAMVLIPEETPQEPELTDPPTCQHPEESRVYFGLPTEEWECTRCRYHHIVPA